MHRRDTAIEPATDDWPFLYLKNRHIPTHYLGALALILVVSTVAVMATLRGQSGRWSWEMFLLGAAFMLLETKSIIQFALLWGSTWFVASLVIAAVLTMAHAGDGRRVAGRDPAAVARVWSARRSAGRELRPAGRQRRLLEPRASSRSSTRSLVFSPIFCAGLLFGSAIKRSTSLSRDYGTNLLGAMVGGVGEYLSLVTGFGALSGDHCALLHRGRRGQAAVTALRICDL